MKTVHVQPITLSCIVESKNNLAKMIIVKRPYVADKNILLGKRSRTRSTLKICAYCIQFWPF